MRVVCHSIEDFIENLVGNKVFRNIVWVDRTVTSLGEQSGNINLQASAVIEVEGGGEILLQYGEDCGIDYLDGEKCLEGTEAMKERRKKLEEYCESVGLKIKPGVADM